MHTCTCCRERKIDFALPARPGGLGIRIPSKAAESEFQSSLLVTSPLKDHILSQNSEYSYETIAEQLQCKATISKLNREKSVNDANDLAHCSSPH